MTDWRITVGDCRDVLRAMPARNVHTVVTSPPYFGLRDYRTEGQIGLEPTPDEFVAALVEVFREVRRVLRDDGTVWLNLGDSYNSRLDASHGGWNGSSEGPQVVDHRGPTNSWSGSVRGLAQKNLLGMPWRVAFGLQADGWILRSDIVWSKPNPMPESVTDRPTKAHEYVFLLSKGPRYAYDADAIREPHDEPHRGHGERESATPHSHRADGDARGLNRQPVFVPAVRQYNLAGRNKRSVWTVATQPYAGAHFATFPPKLIEPCILAGAPEGGCVLDPFAGAGTTGLVALQHGRDFIGIELNPEYAAMARERIETAGRLGFRAPSSGPEQIPGQTSFFDLNGAT